jgi:hypothetical protein
MPGTARSPVIEGSGGRRTLRFSARGLTEARAVAIVSAMRITTNMAECGWRPSFRKSERPNLTRADLNAIAKRVKEMNHLLESGEL